MTPDQMNAQMFATLSQIQRDVADIKAALTSRGAAPQNGSNGAPTPSSGPKEGTVADDRDLDSSHGDPTIKFDPSAKYWNEESFVGYHFSETRPEYLDAMAKYLDACAYMAEKDTDEKKRKGAFYKRKDAARARGWAARLRAGNVAPAQSPPASTGYGGTTDDGGLGMDDVPFCSSSISHDLHRWGLG